MLPNFWKTLSSRSRWNIFLHAQQEMLPKVSGILLRSEEMLPNASFKIASHRLLHFSTQVACICSKCATITLMKNMIQIG